MAYPLEISRVGIAGQKHLITRKFLEGGIEGARLQFGHSGDIDRLRFTRIICLCLLGQAVGIRALFGSVAQPASTAAAPVAESTIK